MPFDAGDIEARLILDRSQFIRELKEAEREAKAFEDKKRTATVGLELDTKKAQADLDKFIAELAGLKDAKVELELDVKKANKDLEKFKDSLKDIKKKDIELELKLETAKAMADLERFKTELAGVNDVDVDLNLDTDKAMADLQAFKAALGTVEDGTVKIKADLDLAGIRAQLEAIARDLAIELEVELVGEAALLAQIEALTGDKKLRIEIELTGSTEAFAEIRELVIALNALDGRNIRIKIDIDGAAGAFGEIAALLAALSLLDGRRITIHIDLDGIAGALAQIAALIAALELLRGLSGSLGVGGAFSLSSIFGGLPAMIAGAAVAATGLAVAGAGITVAFGAVATAIAAVPPLLLFVAAPLGAIALGVEGIKAAFETLTPEVNALKEAVSLAFVDGLMPVVEQLATSNFFPVITEGMTGMATALSTIAQGVSTFITSAEGLTFISLALDQISAALTAMTPGITDIVAGFLQVAATAGLFDGLADVVNNFGAAFRESVTNTLNDGSLQGAIDGLTGTLDAMGQAFIQLTEGGIQAFAAAAPGAIEFIQSIGDLMSQFDWAALGEAAGGVFDGISDALDSVPIGVIQEIEAAFEGLGDVFEGGAMQEAIRGLIGNLPEAITLMADLSQLFADIAPYASAAVDAFGNLDGAIKDFNTSAKDAVLAQRDMGTSLSDLQLAAQDFENVMDEFERAIGIIPPLAEEVAGLTQQLEGLPPNTELNVTMTNAAAIELTKLGFQVERLADGSWIVTVRGDVEPAMGPIQGLLAFINTAVATIGVMAEDRGASPAAIGIAATINAIETMLGINAEDRGAIEVGRALQDFINNTLAVFGINAEDRGAADAAAMVEAGISAILASMGITADDRGWSSVSGAAKASIDALMASLGITAEDRGWSTIAGAAKASIDALLATMGINAEDRGWGAVSGAAKAAIDALMGTMGINAEDRGWGAVSGAAKAAIDALMGTMGINAEDRGWGAVSGAAKAAIDALIGTMGIDAEDRGAIAAAAAIQATINAMTATIKVFVSRVVTDVFGGAEGMIYSPRAAGGIDGPVPRNVELMAPGGIGSKQRLSSGMGRLRNMSSSAAQIVSPNTWRVVGDRSLDPEAFIPLNSSMRSRSILKQAAAAMGYGLIPMSALEGKPTPADAGINDAKWQMIVNKVRENQGGGQVDVDKIIRAVTDALRSRSVEHLTVQAPPYSTVKEVCEEAIFQIRHAGKGVHSGNRP